MHATGAMQCKLECKSEVLSHDQTELGPTHYGVPVHLVGLSNHALPHRSSECDAHVMRCTCDAIRMQMTTRVHAYNRTRRVT